MNEKQPDAHHIEVVRTARFYTVGAMDDAVTDVWFALHGYGQLAAEFAREFAPFRREARLIVIPEALSRFYRNNRERVMGASWMTAEDRKMEIRDYVRYLDTLHDRVFERGVREGARLTVLGFSQGTATATRWLAAGSVRADRLILWGGLPAFELCTPEFRKRVPVERLEMVTGTRDRYTSPVHQREILPTLSEPGQPVEQIVFEGGHALDPAVLARLMEGDPGESTT